MQSMEIDETVEELPLPDPKPLPKATSSKYMPVPLLSPKDEEYVALSIFELGLKYASPKILLSLLAEENKQLDQERIKSHLQKFRSRSNEEFKEHYKKNISPQFESYRCKKIIDMNNRPSSRLLRLLIVDDSRMIRKIVSKVIGTLGHTCDEADNGVMGVEMIRRAMESGVNYDVILMDNRMPSLKGVDATKIIREELNYKGIILGVTGYDLEEDIKLFLNNGADKVVMKPLTKDKFTETIHNIESNMR